MKYCTAKGLVFTIPTQCFNCNVKYMAICISEFTFYGFLCTSWHPSEKHCCAQGILDFFFRGFMYVHVLCYVVVSQRSSWHGSYMFPPLVLSRPVSLSVNWPQNCFYKCRSHCSIALQPNHITRLFSYSSEVERKERLVLPLLPINSLPLVQQQRRRQSGHFFVPLVFFSVHPSSALLFPSLSLFPTLLSFIFHLCPDFTKPCAPTPFTPILEQIYISGSGFSKCWLPCHWILHTSFETGIPFARGFVEGHL